MIYKEHTRNQKRMYRIHKMEEQIEKDKYIIGNQEQEIERLINIIKKIEKMFNHETLIKYYYGMSYVFEINDFKDDIFEIIKGSDKE